MTRVQAMDGSYMADEDYLHDVISRPNMHPIAGYQPIMPPTEGLLNDKDVSDIIAYIKTLSSQYHPAKMPGHPAPAPAASQPSK